MVLALVLCGSLFTPAADAESERLAEAMTPAERVTLLRGEKGVRSAGYVPGVVRLAIPALQETDASLGIANADNLRRGDVATALPSSLSLASTWDPGVAERDGTILGDEAWRKGFNVLLGPGLNLARDPRNGRNFEYLGEDPLLAGTLAGAEICGIQSRHVVATVKHFAMNDQETGRDVLSADIGDAAMRESDLLAFELALETGHPGAVMCAYNRVNGTYACENSHLLDDILKGAWSFPGWVMSDWGAVRDARAPDAGLDQESAHTLDRVAVDFSAIPQARLIEMNRRILRSMLAVGLFEAPTLRSPIDYVAHAADALDAAQRGIVVLKNDGVLPLGRQIHRIAVIGGHADAGVLSGGGSAQVLPVGRAMAIPLGGDGASLAFYDRSPPLAALRALAPGTAFSFSTGRYASEAAALAHRADVAIVFATQWLAEGKDAPDLSLPDGQDALVDAVAAANPRTIVVLETGNPVAMPWLDRVAGVVEAWYPGQRGGEAIAGVLTGAVDPSGRLPITFPAAESQLVHPDLPGLDQLLWLTAGGLRGDALAVAMQPFSVEYSEGSDVGYRRYQIAGLKPLFAFGHGLSYTTFRYGGFHVTPGPMLTATFDVTNTGPRRGTDTPQLYLTGHPGGPATRLLGWSHVTLDPGQTGSVTIAADPHVLADFDEALNAWAIPEGTYEVSLGSASDALQAHAVAAIAGRQLPR